MVFVTHAEFEFIVIKRPYGAQSSWRARQISLACRFCCFNYFQNSCKSAGPQFLQAQEEHDGWHAFYRIKLDAESGARKPDDCCWRYRRSHSIRLARCIIFDPQALKNDSEFLWGVPVKPKPQLASPRNEATGKTLITGEPKNGWPAAPHASNKSRQAHGESKWINEKLASMSFAPLDWANLPCSNYHRSSEFCFGLFLLRNIEIGTSKARNVHFATLSGLVVFQKLINRDFRILDLKAGLSCRIEFSATITSCNLQIAHSKLQMHTWPLQQASWLVHWPTTCSATDSNPLIWTFLAPPPPPLGTCRATSRPKQACTSITQSPCKCLFVYAIAFGRILSEFTPTHDQTLKVKIILNRNNNEPTGRSITRVHYFCNPRWKARLIG